MIAANERAGAFHALTVAGVEPQTRDAIAVSFEVAPALAQRFRFEAGQYVTLRADIDGSEIRRSYSICSAPHEGVLRVAIKRVDDGLFSQWAHGAIVPGARIEVSPPEGRFCLPAAPAGAAHYLAFAAGSGITPVLSLAKTVLNTLPDATFTLVYGNRASSSVMFGDELHDLKDRYLDRLALIFVMSRERQDVDLFNGRIDRAKCDALLERWIDPATVDTAFVCGPYEMTHAVTASLAAHGLEGERVKTELFAAGPREPRARSGTAQARGIVRAYAIADGRRQDFEIRKGTETVLEAGLRQGVDLPYSCKGGVCSTCRTRLVAGEVDMDIHYALEDYEIKRGYILACQSYPVSDEIGIDYDEVSHA